MNLDKASLRKLFTQKRAALSAAEYEGLNAQLSEQFQRLDLPGVRYLHIFLPIISRREPDTLPMIDWLKSSHPEITLAYPKTNFTDNSMEAYADDAQLVLSEIKQGITEPVHGHIIPVDKIDMIILPLLAFDKRGYRVGYGKGFYDRYIARCRPDVHLVGLSLFNPSDEIIDVDQFDKKMQRCVTPQKIWRI